MTLPPEALRLPPDLLENAVVLSDRYEILPRLPKGLEFVEVGVGLGDWTQTIMWLCDPRRIIAIDNFKLHEEPTFWGKAAAEHFGQASHEDMFRARFAHELSSGMIAILSGDSAVKLATLPDESVDVVYIDADHHYEPVRQDLAEARRKVRRDGWIIVNDYIMVDTLNATTPYGVVHATNEFMIEHGWGMQYLALQTRMYCDVVLRPLHCLPGRAMRSDGLEAENDLLRGELLALRNSRSWRMTAPMRAWRRSLSSRLGKPT